MNLKLTALGIIAAVGFAACDAAVSNTNTNINRAVANGNANTAVVVNSNSTVNSNTVSNSNRMNANMSREDFDRDRARYEGEAKNSNSTIGSGPNDLWLWTKTRAALLTTDDLRESTIDVDVANEVVTLEGTVATAAQRTRAEQVAKGIEGVKSVKNTLKVAPNDSITNMNSGNANAGRTNVNKK